MWYHSHPILIRPLAWPVANNVCQVHQLKMGPSRYLRTAIPKNNIKSLTYLWLLEVSMKARLRWTIFWSTTVSLFRQIVLSTEEESEGLQSSAVYSSMYLWYDNYGDIRRSATIPSLTAWLIPYCQFSLLALLNFLMYTSGVGNK